MRLIDADKLKNGGTLCEVFSNPTDEFYGMLQLIDAQPTVDAIEVVRCKNCPHNKTIECPMCESISGDGAKEKTYWNKDNDFCSYGEQEEHTQEEFESGMEQYIDENGSL